MNTRCDFKTFNECSCEEQCAQIIVDRAPIIRPFPKRQIALFGFIAAMVGLVSMYALGSRLDEHFHQQDLIAQESTHARF